MGKIVKLETQDANRCFGCGGNNQAGMRLVFDLDFDAKRTRGRFILGENYAGGAGFAHGGIIAVVLDEAMGKISKLTEEKAVTAEMNVVYRKPVPVDKEIVVEGWQEDEKGRNRFRVGEIRDVEGNLLARGTARFVAIDQEHFEKVRATEQKV
jgi:acyl-coenzyme A thioesterase PaaI-like protein